MLREQDMVKGPEGVALPSNEVVAVSPVMARMLPPLSVEAIADAATFAAMRAEWNALVEASDAGVFNSWDWVYPWFRRIGADRELRILAALDVDGRLVGVMPLCLESRRVGGRSVRRISFLGESHVGSDYLDVVALRGQEEAIARSFATYLRDTCAGWDVIDLLDFDEQSITVKVFSEVFGTKYQVKVTDRYLCPYEKLQASEPFDAFLKRTARRDNFLRRKKWLEKQPGYRIEKTVVPAALARAMTEFFRLHSARWAEDGGSQGIKGPSVEAFHRDATHLLAEQGKLRLYTMWLEGKAVASVYGIIDRGTFSYFQSGADPELRNKSVGLVLIGETFRDAIESGCHTYDFLRGTETYKSDWVTLQRKTVAVRIHAAKGAGAWMSTHEEFARKTRELAKRMMPTNLVEKVRRLRRQKAQI